MVDGEYSDDGPKLYIGASPNPQRTSQPRRWAKIEKMKKLEYK